ncbi:MAG TPA: TetR/AcrR family transcriptional regulator [Fimbriimonadales bacterium]|nr:TetR/AcrR family transcriptional regulator [Fimbriimonadales bacterium]
MNSESLPVHPMRRANQATLRRRQLLDAALKVFSEKGYEEATMKDVSEKAGVAPGLLYHYFESKEILLMEVVQEHGFVPEICKVMSPNPERPAREVLLEQAQEIYRLFDKKQSLIRVFVREAMNKPRLYELWVKHIKEGARHLAKYLQARVDAGELRKHNTEMSARMLLHSVILFHIVGDPPEKLNEVVDCLLYGILK